MSRWRVSTGRSVGSRGPPPSWWMMSSAPITRTNASKSAALPAPSPPIEIGVRTPAHRPPRTRDGDSPKDEVALRVAGVELELVTGLVATSASDCAGFDADSPCGAPAAGRRAVLARLALDSSHPPRWNASSARAPRDLHADIPRRIRSPAWCTASTWSVLSSSTGSIGLTSPAATASCWSPGAARRGRSMRAVMGSALRVPTGPRDGCYDAWIVLDVTSCVAPSVKDRPPTARWRCLRRRRPTMAARPSGSDHLLATSRGPRVSTTTRRDCFGLEIIASRRCRRQLAAPEDVPLSARSRDHRTGSARTRLSQQRPDRSPHPRSRFLG